MKILLSNLSGRINAYQNCIKVNNEEWKHKHLDEILLMLEELPHGSGLDNGVSLQLVESSSKKIIFTFSYHHLNENGYYDGWTEHKLIVTPSFQGFDLLITGNDKNDVKDYLYDVFNEVFE